MPEIIKNENGEFDKIMIDGELYPVKKKADSVGIAHNTPDTFTVSGVLIHFTELLLRSISEILSRNLQNTIGIDITALSITIRALSIVELREYPITKSIDT